MAVTCPPQCFASEVCLAGRTRVPNTSSKALSFALVKKLFASLTEINGADGGVSGQPCRKF